MRKPIKMWVAWHRAEEDPIWETLSQSKRETASLRSYYVDYGRGWFPIVRVEIREIRTARKAKAKRRSRAGGAR